MWSIIAKNCEKLVRKERLNSSTVVWIKQSVGQGRRVPKFGVEAGPELPVVQFEKRPAKAGDGNRALDQKQQIAKAVEKHQKLVTMAAGAAKRVPLIRFPNRKAGETQGAKAVAVGRVSGSGGRSQAMPSLPSGTASSQTPRTKLSEAEIEAVLLGAVLEEPVTKKPAPKKQ